MASKDYNIIIIGSGVAGLSFANYALLANPKQKIIIIDKDKTIGGCHKVNRQEYKNEYYFCEHGPRIYSNNYVNFMKLLKTMNLNFYDLFEKDFSFIHLLINYLFKNSLFTFEEFLYLTRDFIFTIFVNNHGMNISMEEYMNNNNFSETTKHKLDIIIRSFDGGDISRYSLHQFMIELMQMFLYNVYIPKLPNDEGLFKYWRRYLELNKVQFELNNGVHKIIAKKDKKEIEKIILANGKEIKGDKFIFAIPPENLSDLLNKCDDTNIKNAFGDYLTFNDFAENTKYNDYISITFHWDSELPNLIDNIDTHNYETEWGLYAFNLSKHMKFKESKSKTVISCGTVYSNVKSNYSNKTANECKDKEELMINIYEQLRTIYKNIPKPTLYFINNYYDEKNKVWESNETAFLKTPKYDYIPFTSSYNNIYTLGTHNGKHKYSFTSVESAISNSIKLSNIIFNQHRKIHRFFDIRDLIIVILSIIILLLLIRYTYYYKWS
jgi:predicted NAD/FAD-dependent oxidoreductase